MSIINSSLNLNSAKNNIGLFNVLSDELLLKIFNYLDIKDILNMSKSTRFFNNLAKDLTLWKSLASEVGLDVLDNASLSDIKNQLQEIYEIAKRCNIAVQPITIKELRNVFSEIQKIKYTDFLTVWQKIAEQTSILLTIPPSSQTKQNHNILNTLLGEWIEKNKTHINSFTFLTFSKLNLHFLPESIGKLSNLKILKLDSNKLISIAESIGQLGLLEFLDLQNNNLTFLPESIGKLVKLKFFYLQNNNLTFLPESIGQLGELRFSHQDASLPKFIGKLPVLQILDLSNNKLISIPKSFKKFSNSTKLKLYNNPLTSYNKLHKFLLNSFPKIGKKLL